MKTKNIFYHVGLISVLILFFLFTRTTEAVTTLTNPLGTNDIRVVIGRVVQFLLGIGGALALLMFVWGGILWITSAGNPDKVKKGRDTFVWATIGLVVILTAYSLVNAVITAITAGTV